MSITFQGEAVSVSGSFPQAGQSAQNFTLCSAELADITLESMKGQKLVLNIFPSIDTPVCAASVREFHQKLASVQGVAVLNISADLPFATGRFCTSESIDSVQNFSFFRSPTFTEDYGVNLNEGALKGLATRAVVVVDEEGKVMHSERVSEITEEPNYQAVLDVVGA